MSKKAAPREPEQLDSPVVRRLDELDRKMSQIHSGISDAFQRFAAVIECKGGAASEPDHDDPPPHANVPRIEAQLSYLDHRADDAIGRLADLVERAQC